ncbi:MAG: proline--tRNA ligase [Candidatus Norongarragalinales archaeon]
MLKHKKESEFSEWFLELVQASELMDYGPVQGCMVVRERAYAIWERIQEEFNKKIKADGVRNVYFPLLIPESFLKKEAEHFAGFVPEVAWVTQGGNDELGERLALRPTSETIIYASFAKWISSHRDLPLKVNQWCNVVRWDTKALKPFLRTREFLWQEGHTAHATREEAVAQVGRALGWYKEICEELLALPVLVGVKSDSEKFPGAEYTTTFELLMPDGKALQGGTSHLLGQNFAKMFNIKFKTEDEREEFVWTTSWGVTTRLIGALAAIHGDNAGLVLPPRVAPLQCVIIPIFYNEEERKMALFNTTRIKKEIEAKGISVLVDDRTERTPGWKFNEWELKGVPIRIEIGVRDMAQEGVTIVRRDNGVKEFVRNEKIADFVEYLLNDIQLALFRRAKERLEAGISDARDTDDLKNLLDERKGFVRAAWCGDARCEEAIKEESGASIRLIPFDDAPRGECVLCGKPSKATAFFARSY